jgi:hypothetical protein
MPYLTDDEQHELWEPDDEPCGPAARAWEPPEIRAARYEKALRGILACASPEPTVWLLQSVAASALGYDALADDLLRRVMARSNAPEGAP